MNYISLDLEFNGAFDFATGRQGVSDEACHHEVIQIGAVKMNEEREIIDRFNVYIKPSIYPRLNPFISEVIKMKTSDFKDADGFEKGFLSFKEFLGGEANVFVVWGSSDLPILYENISYYGLVKEPLILKYINIQPYVGSLLGRSGGHQISLKDAICQLGIEDEEHYHNALYDAYYTAKIFEHIKPAGAELKLFCSSHYKGLK